MVNKEWYGVDEPRLTVVELRRSHALYIMPWVRLRQESINIEGLGTESRVVQSRMRVWEFAILIPVRRNHIKAGGPHTVLPTCHITLILSLYAEEKSAISSPNISSPPCVCFANCFAFSEFQILDRPTTPTRIPFHPRKIFQ